MKAFDPMKALCAFSILLLTFAAAAAAGFAHDYAEGKFLGKSYSSVLYESQLKDSPPWDCEKSQPPLSAKKAVSIAIEYAEGRLGHHPDWPTSPGWALNQVSLVAVDVSNIWYYRVSLTPKVPGSGSRPSVTVFVTLDGKAIPLTEQKK